MAPIMPVLFSGKHLKVSEKEKTVEIFWFQRFFGGDKRDRTADLLNAIEDALKNQQIKLDKTDRIGSNKNVLNNLSE